MDGYSMQHKNKYASLLLSLLMLTSRLSRISSLSMSTTTTTTMKSKLQSKQNLNFYWFRHQDLRLHDNPALQTCIDATIKKDDGSGIVPVFCFDPRFVGNQMTTPFGSSKCGVGRAQFLLESVQDLRNNLEAKGSGLVVAYGKAEDVMENLTRVINSGDPTNVLRPNVYCQEEIASEELAVDKAMKRILKVHDGKLTSTWGSALYDIEDLPYINGVHDMPDTFTPFRNKMEKKCQIGAPIPSPSKSSLALPKNQAVLDILKSSNTDETAIIPNCSLSYMPTLKDLGYSNEEISSVKSPDERGVMHFQGGETAALARVQDYIFTKDRLKIYFDTRNGMLGADYSTKFSPWLAHGCLSPRFVAKECKRYEEETGIVNKSTYW